MTINAIIADDHELVREALQVRLQRMDVKIVAEAVNGTYQPWDQLSEALIRADVVVTSTGATTPIIEPRMMRKIMRKRRGAPIFMVDIAVPRDVDPKVGRLDSVYVYDVDDLRLIF